MLWTLSCIPDPGGKEFKDIFPDHKTGRKCKVPLSEQFFLVLIRLRMGLLVHDLAFGLGKDHCVTSYSNSGEPNAPVPKRY